MSFEVDTGGFTTSQPQTLTPTSSPTFAGLTLSGMTAGSVLFAGAGGLVSQDNVNFAYNNSTDTLTVANFGSSVFAGTITGGTFSGIALSGATTLPGSGQITSGGNLGLGGAPLTNYRATIRSILGQILNSSFATNDYSDGVTGTRLAIYFGAATGSAYTGIAASIAGNTLPGQLVLNENGGGVSVGTTAVAGGGNLRVSGNILIADATAIPAGGTAGVGYMFSSTANFGVFFGSGVPSLSAAKGSLYLRSDGSGIADRAYINTNGSTTWTAIATAG